MNKGKTELRINNPDDAIYSLNKAVEMQPDLGEAFYWLGLAELARENNSAGCDYLLKAQALSFEAANEAISQNCMQ